MAARHFKHRPARLLHVGAFGLDEPVEGLAGLPERLRQLHATAPQLAMARTFDAALAHRVDAVLLAGGLPCRNAAGFRGTALVFEQCRRLAEAGIPVVVAGGEQHDWSYGGVLRRPSNVFFVARGSRDVVTVGDTRRRSRLDIGSAAIASNARLQVALASPREADRVRDVDYVALLGHGTAATEHDSSRKKQPIWDAGSAQGRSVDATGEHGALLVTLSRDAKPRVEPIACDVLRHHEFRVEPSDGTTWDDLHGAIWSHAERLRGDHSVRAHFGHWVVRGHGPAWEQLRIDGVRREVLGSARAAFGEPASGPAVWPVSIDVVPDKTQKRRDAGREDSLGRFVRTLDHQRAQHQDEAISLAAHLLA